MTAVLDETLQRSMLDKLAEWENRAEQRALARPGYYIERARVIPILERWLKCHSADYPSGNDRNIGQYPTSALAEITGVTERQIRLILRGKTSVRNKLCGGPYPMRSLVIEGGEKYLTLDMVDRLLTGLGLVHLFYMPPEAGGFSDVYFHESVMNAA